MQDIVFSLDILKIFIISVLVFILYYLILRKSISLWYDPLLLYLVFNSASVGLVIYLWDFAHQIEYFYFYTFMLSTIGFAVGMLIANHIYPLKYKNTLVFNTCYKYYNLFQVFLLLSVLLVIFSNILMFIGRGTVPIFSANPSLAKVTLYTGGWGIIRRTNLVFTNYIFAISLLYLYHPIIKATKRVKLICYGSIIVAVLVLITTGSKSSLLTIVNILFGVSMINLIYKNGMIKKVTYNLNLIKKFSIWTFVFAIVYMFVVIVLTGVQTSAGDSFVTRLIAAGDTFYFFYVFDIYKDFKPVSGFQYFLHILNPLLGFFRLVPYEYPIGAYIIYYSIGQPLDESFGPNAQHPIEGLLYFGKYGTFFYSVVIGFIIVWFRSGILNKITKNLTFSNCIIYIVLTSFIVNLAIEAANFFSLFYDTAIFGFIVFMMSLIVQKSFRP